MEEIENHQDAFPVGREELRILGGLPAFRATSASKSCLNRLGTGVGLAAIALEGGIVVSAHRPTTRSRSSALVATCRYTAAWLTPSNWCYIHHSRLR